MTKDQQVAIQKALTRVRNAQARVAKVREDNTRREQDALALERAALDALADVQKAAGLVPDAQPVTVASVNVSGTVTS